MWSNIAIGAVIISVTVLVQSIGLIILSRSLSRAILHYPPEKGMRTVAFMLATVLGLFAIHAIEIWIWALTYLWLGALPNLHDALFFSTLSFSTLGAEDISATPEWRLLGSIEGVNGFLLIGWSTAYLLPAWLRYGPFHGNRDF